MTEKCFLIGIIIFFLSQSQTVTCFTEDFEFLKKISCELTPKVTVAAEGSGDFFTITAGLVAISKKNGRVVIHVKAGLYAENVVIT
ncbi:hypothetical protein ARALYDRAFT_897699 [Arabidopsis lyrata subsp. lyrata]|uniref:Pectinesterase catalytic domain-containing protein n=1 Tax=Arabidopsis lyrata subsp. lyrata TaxID=81972 RepID=D7L331_ARALL|nr:hypothetical protein ARALYDRAFT_897699 [Arabidopsis lyrata subsp. lyrata]